jgi:hypothetical protein
MRRRECFALLGGAAVWPLAARAQQPEQMRRIGVLMPYASDDPEIKSRLAAFHQALEQLGWSEGNNFLSLPKTPSTWHAAANRVMNCRMRDLFKLIWWMLVGRLRSRASLEAEILALRHQLNVLQRKSGERCLFSNFDRLIFTGLYRIAPHVLAALTIHRGGLNWIR